MSIAEMAKVLGKAARWNVDGRALEVDVRIVDVRSAYGNLRYQIQPLSGTGTRWVNASTVTVRES